MKAAAVIALLLTAAPALADDQRRHVWELVARAAPAFETWAGEADIFGKSEGAHRGIAGFSREGIAGVRDTSQSSGAPVLAYTLYNAAAADHIRRARLNDAATLAGLRDEGTVPAFPTDALIVKTVWWPVAHDRPTAMPVWDAPDNPPLPNGNPYTTWTRSLTVSTGHLEAFHHVAVDADLARRIMQDSEARKTTLLALGRPLEAGDELALVGLNLASRETPEWTWAALWWHDEAGDADRPASLGGPWSNYLMQVATDPDAPAAADGGPHIAFNPWLEGRFPDGGNGGGTRSNCMACHLKASYPAMPFLPVTRGRPALSPNGVRTSLIWSLAMHARLQ